MQRQNSPSTVDYECVLYCLISGANHSWTTYCQNKVNTWDKEGENNSGCISVRYRQLGQWMQLWRYHYGHRWNNWIYFTTIRKQVLTTYTISFLLAPMYEFVCEETKYLGWGGNTPVPTLWPHDHLTCRRWESNPCRSDERWACYHCGERRARYHCGERRARYHWAFHC